MKKYHLRADVRHRFVRLLNELQFQLQRDEDGFDFLSLGNLIPCLFSVYSLLWCKRVSDLFCKKCCFSNQGYIDNRPRLVSKEFFVKAKSALYKVWQLEHDGSDDLPF